MSTITHTDAALELQQALRHLAAVEQRVSAGEADVTNEQLRDAREAVDFARRRMIGATSARIAQTYEVNFREAAGVLDSIAAAVVELYDICDRHNAQALQLADEVERLTADFGVDATDIEPSSVRIFRRVHPWGLSAAALAACALQEAFEQEIAGATPDERHGREMDAAGVRPNWHKLDQAHQALDVRNVLEELGKP